MTSVAPFLWYSHGAHEAVALYVSLFPDSGIDGVTGVPVETPSGPPGAVQVVSFTLAGRPMTAMSAARGDAFNHSVSLVATCETQAEIDRVWDALSAGGTVEQCGWLKDRWGVSWQVVPKVLPELMGHPDRERASRVAKAMMGMVKFDIAGLRRAFEGE